MIVSIFLAGVVGALIGSVVSIITTLLSAKLQHRQQLVQHATQVAIEDFKVTSELASQGGRLYPMSTYIHYHLSFLRLAERGELDEAAIRALLDERGRLLDLYARYPAERHAFLSGATEGEPSKADDLVTPALRRLEFACDGEPSYTTPCR